MRAAICDDEKKELEKIKNAADLYFRDAAYPVKLDTFTEAFSFLDAVEQGTVYDLILLDVCMPGLLGTEAARELRQQKNPAEIIFFTASRDFAVDAFAVKATDYVIKPFTQKEFNRALDRAVLNIRQRQSAKLLFRLVGGGIRVEKVSNILFFENHGHILHAYLEDGEVLETRITSLEMKAELDKIVPDQFQSPNKGYLVNLEKIRQITSLCVEVGSHKISLGRRKFRGFEKLYFDFMFRH